MNEEKYVEMLENGELYDYITNLQQKEELFEKIVYKYDELKQENGRLKLDKDTKSASEIICENLHDVYKSRCEKAVEYINYFGTTPEQNDDTTCRLILKSLLNILNGRSDE